MKKIISTLILVTIFTTVFSQNGELTTCYTKYAKVFEKRGAYEVTDSIYDNVIITIRKGSMADCFYGKVNVKNGNVDYEFRTTAVPGIHQEKNFLEIAKWLDGAKKYCLQEYRDQNILDPNLKQKTGNKKLDLDKIKKSIESHFQKVEVRKYSD